MTEPLIFDGHNDVLTRLYRAGGRAAAGQFLDGREGDIDLPRARAGGLAGGFFAVWIPDESHRGNRDDMMTQAEYDMPLPPLMDADVAARALFAEASILMELERLGALRICRSVAEIRATMGTDRMAAVFHLEGAEAIDADLALLDVLHGAGLRSLGPVWSRPTIFAHGVPFRYPSSPDIGPGLTEAGTRLVKRCNDLRIMIDLSHLNEAGFWDVARLTDAPLVASHSNAHAICPHARNLTDKQLAAIAESGGLVGLNYAAAFLREDGRMLADTPIDICLRHLDHLIGILGEDGVALGSDHDGAVPPAPLKGAENLDALRGAMRAHGYGETLIAKICHRNWLRVLTKTWGA